MIQDSPFLKAEWRRLVMLNYEVDPAILRDLLPVGTELDSWMGKTFVSMVGFLFLKTRIFNISIPFHSNFEEVNLRFYVIRRMEGKWRRGVVFVKELVPRRAIAYVARAFYNENYLAVPMNHEWVGDHRTVYKWQSCGRENSMEIEAEGLARDAEEGSLEQFITEHYWGYVRQRNGGTMEYEVRHPRWRVNNAKKACLDCDVEGLYGRRFAPFLQSTPVSAFLAEGSAVTIFKGTRLT